MKTKNYTLLFSMLLSMVGFDAFAGFDTSNKVPVGDLYYYLDSENSAAEVTSSYNSGTYAGDIAIPATIDYNSQKYSVTSIGSYTFQSCSGLTSIIIPKSVMTIGYLAFDDCSGLTSIKVEPGNTQYDSRNNCNAIIETSSNTLIAGCMNTIIPEGVKSIGEAAFSCRVGLTSINIPEDVTSIGPIAFANCTGLTSITLPDSMTTIRYQTFVSCTGLTSINLGNRLTFIASGAFSNCTALTFINIPKSVMEIYDGGWTFYGCKSLTSIKVEPGNSFYDSRDNCNAIIQIRNNTLVVGCDKTIIPKGVKSIGSAAFIGRSNLTSINIPESVTKIGEAAFRECSNLTSINIPDSMRYIGDASFAYCTNLTSINIPEKVWYIGHSAFSGCTGLTSINIPDTVQSIGNFTFQNCSNLTSITIPASVNKIGINSFDGCTGFKDVYCYGTAVPETENSAFENVALNDVVLHVPAQSVEAYKAHEVWGQFWSVVPLTDEEMGIASIESRKREGNASWYDLHGRRVHNGESLHPNIYIKEDKKIVYK